MDKLFASPISRAEKVVYACALLLLVLYLYAHFAAAYIGDKTWLLFAADGLVKGKKLYVDIFEVNPPLIYWIYEIPAYLAVHFGVLRDYHFLALMGFATIALVIWLSLHLQKHASYMVADKKQQREFCLLLATVLITFTNPIYFFDREHIFLLLTLPYVFRWMPSLTGKDIPRGLRVLVGILAGIGFCIKPHCVVFFVCIQLVYFVHMRSAAILWSIENMLIYMAAVAYMAAIKIYTPEYLQVVIPMALASYDVINHSNGGKAFFMGALLTLGITFADFRLRYHSPYRKDILYLLALCLGYLAYALVNNGWGYTWNPLASLILIITGFVLWEFQHLQNEYESKGLASKQFVHGILACLINFFIRAVVTCIVFYYAFARGCGNYLDCDYGVQFENSIITANDGMKVRSFGTISIDSDLWAYLSRTTGAAWVTRFNHLWMLPKFFIETPQFAQDHHWILDYVGKAYAEDMHRNRPELMFVDDNEVFFSVHKHEDMLAYLLPIPEFAQEWKHYRFATRIDKVLDAEKKRKHNGYDVYKRID